MATLRPIQGEVAMRFWSSSILSNRIMAICAYSLDAEDANMNLHRYGYSNSFRKRVINSGNAVYNNALMTGITYNEGNVPLHDIF